MSNYKASNCIIIARYNENVDWLMKLIYKYSWIQEIIIFNKGINDFSDIIKNSNKIRIIQKKNIGRESETYLSYIIDNYFNLPKYIWFVQGSPFDHSPDFIDLLSENSINYYIHKEFQSLTWRYDDNLPMNIESDRRFYINNNRIINYYIDIESQQTVEAHSFYDSMHAIKVDYLNNKTPKPYNNYLEYMCGISKLPLPKKIISYCWSAIFYLNSNSILKNKLETYIKLREILLSDDDQGGYQGYILERMWHYIFTHSSYNNIKDLHQSIDWKYSDLCLCWNSNLGYVTLYDKSYQVHHTTKTITKLHGYVMIYFVNNTQSFEIHYNSYIDFVPIAIFPCLNIETAQMFLQFQINNYKKINYNYLNTINNLFENNIKNLLYFNKKKIKFKENDYSKMNNSQDLYKNKNSKELLYDTFGVIALKKYNQIP